MILILIVNNIFGFELSSSELSRVLLIVLASIARRIKCNFSGPPSISGVSYENLYIYIYNISSDDDVSSKASSRGISCGIAARLGILASAGRTRIIGVLLHGTSCCFRVQFVLTHETLIIFVMWFTKYAHFVLACAMPRSLSRSAPWVKCGVPTICFIFALVYDLHSSLSIVMIEVLCAPAYDVRFIYQ